MKEPTKPIKVICTDHGYIDDSSSDEDDPDHKTEEKPNIQIRSEDYLYPSTAKP